LMVYGNRQYRCGLMSNQPRIMSLVVLDTVKLIYQQTLKLMVELEIK